MGIASGLDDVARFEDRVVSMLGVSDQDALEGLQLGGEGVTPFVRLVLEDDGLVVAEGLEVPIVGAGEHRDEDLEPGCVHRHPVAGEELLPMLSVDRPENVGRALELSHEIAHRDVDAAARQIASNPIERRQHHEMLVK